MSEDGKTPGLSPRERQDVNENQPPRAAVLHEIIRTQGDQELERKAAALWWSALAAGLTMGLSLMAMGLLHARLPDSPSSQVIASLGYSAGFLAVILARQQLFTENTLTAVLPVMSQPTLHNLGRLLRLWGVVLAGNLAGTLLVAWVMLHLPIFDGATDRAFLDIGRKVMENDNGQMFAKGIVSGWMIATLVWMIPSGKRQAAADHPRHLPDGPGGLHPHRGRFGGGVLPGVRRAPRLGGLLARLRRPHPGGQHRRRQPDLRPDQPRPGAQRHAPPARCAHGRGGGTKAAQAGLSGPLPNTNKSNYHLRLSGGRMSQ